MDEQDVLLRKLLMEEEFLEEDDEELDEIYFPSNFFIEELVRRLTPPDLTRKVINKHFS